MRDEFIKEKVKWPENFTDVNFLKIAYCARFNYKECLEKAKKHINWINDSTMHNI